MRHVAAILLISAIASACGGGASGREDDGADDGYSPASYRAEAESDMEAVASAHDELRNKLQSLEDEVSRFGGENWRDVVPDAEYALEEAEQALDELENRVQSEGIEDHVDTRAIRRRLEAVRSEIDGFQDTRNWSSAVEGTEGEMGFDGTLDELESEIEGVREEEPEYGDAYEP